MKLPYTLTEHSGAHICVWDMQCVLYTDLKHTNSFFFYFSKLHFMHGTLL
jgi:hypothetical protein